jgi:hypothetical protein
MNRCPTIPVAPIIPTRYLVLEIFAMFCIEKTVTVPKELCGYLLKHFSELYFADKADCFVSARRKKPP